MAIADALNKLTQNIIRFRNVPLAMLADTSPRSHVHFAQSVAQKKVLPTLIECLPHAVMSYVTSHDNVPMVALGFLTAIVKKALYHEAPIPFPERRARGDRADHAAPPTLPRNGRVCEI
jgi:hypothetical protein